MEQEIAPTAQDDLDRLPQEAAERLLAKFKEAGEWPDHYLSRLSGHPYYNSGQGS